MKRALLFIVVFALGACCRSQTVDDPVFLDGGIPDGFTDAACEQTCLEHYGSFTSCGIKPATNSTPEHIACYAHPVCL